MQHVTKNIKKKLLIQFRSNEAAFFYFCACVWLGCRCELESLLLESNTSDKPPQSMSPSQDRRSFRTSLPKMLSGRSSLPETLTLPQRMSLHASEQKSKSRLACQDVPGSIGSPQYPQAIDVRESTLSANEQEGVSSTAGAKTESFETLPRLIMRAATSAGTPTLPRRCLGAEDPRGGVCPRDRGLSRAGVRAAPGCSSAAAAPGFRNRCGDT